MSNVDKRNGFNLILSSGRQTRRVIRNVTAAGNPTNTLMPGDAYSIQADGTITRATATTATVNGIVEAMVLKGVNEGPISYDYAPAGVTIDVIGIEDPQAEFECTATVALALLDYDSGARVALTDTTGQVSPAQSRQAIGAINGSGPFALIQPVDRVNNDKFAQYARVIVRIFNLIQ